MVSNPGSGSMLVGCRVHFFQKGTLNHLKKVWGRHPSTELMPSRPSGREWRYVLSHFRNIIYGANTRKHSEVMSKMPNREQPITSKRHTNFNMDGILQWLSFCETELWKWNFRILKRLLKRGILSKSIRLLPFLIQICSFRKAKGWSYRIDKAICTVRNRPKSSRISRSNEDAKREALSRYPPIMGSSLLQRALPGAGQDAHTGNLLCSLARLSYLGAGRLSKAFARSLRTNPRQKRQWLC